MKGPGGPRRLPEPVLASAHSKIPTERPRRRADARSGGRNPVGENGRRVPPQGDAAGPLRSLYLTIPRSFNHSIALSFARRSLNWK
jgi:hypothetical protein